MDELSIDSLKTLNVNKLAFNKDKFGPLVFEESAPLLEKLVKLANEFEELDYKGNLSSHEINAIDSFKENLLGHVMRIRDFDINIPNPKDTHDNYENQIKNFYNDITSQLRSSLVYLRQEAQYKTRGQKELKKLQHEAFQARSKFEELSKHLKKEIETLEKQKEKIETEHGEIASKILANYFDKEAEEYYNHSKRWLSIWSKHYKWLLLIIIVNIALYFVLFFFGDKLEIVNLKTTEVFTIPYLLVKVALISFLSYGLRFSSKNYSVSSNLLAQNNHRKNVAQTLEDYLGADPDPEIRSEVVKEGVKAMFKHLPIGYIGKNEVKDSGNPVHEIINYFAKPTA